MTTAIHRRVDSLRCGADPSCIGRVPSGWFVLGDPQVLPGYCLLLPDPVVPDLNAMTGQDRQQFLADMAQCGDVLQLEFGAVRINYAMFGNVEPALHAHLFPRRLDEPSEQVTAQPWALDWQGAPRFDPLLHGELMVRLRNRLREKMPAAVIPRQT